MLCGMLKICKAACICAIISIPVNKLNVMGILLSNVVYFDFQK